MWQIQTTSGKVFGTYATQAEAAAQLNGNPDGTEGWRIVRAPETREQWMQWRAQEERRVRGLSDDELWREMHEMAEAGRREAEVRRAG